jgi:hypothetical protein
MNAGIWVDNFGSTHKGLGVLSKTPGYGATVYYTTDSSPPPDLTGTSWHQVAATRSANKKERFGLSGPARTAKFYLLVINSLPSGGTVRINEIQLLP